MIITGVLTQNAWILTIDEPNSDFSSTIMEKVENTEKKDENSSSKAHDIMSYDLKFLGGGVNCGFYYKDA